MILIDDEGLSIVSLDFRSSPQSPVSVSFSMVSSVFVPVALVINLKPSILLFKLV